MADKNKPLEYYSNLFTELFDHFGLSKEKSGECRAKMQSKDVWKKYGLTEKLFNVVMWYIFEFFLDPIADAITATKAKFTQMELDNKSMKADVKALTEEKSQMKDELDAALADAKKKQKKIKSMSESLADLEETKEHLKLMEDNLTRVKKDRAASLTEINKLQLEKDILSAQNEALKSTMGRELPESAVLLARVTALEIELKDRPTVTERNTAIIKIMNLTNERDAFKDRYNKLITVRKPALKRGPPKIKLGPSKKKRISAPPSESESPSSSIDADKIALQLNDNDSDTSDESDSRTTD